MPQEVATIVPRVDLCAPVPPASLVQICCPPGWICGPQARPERETGLAGGFPPGRLSFVAVLWTRAARVWKLIARTHIVGHALTRSQGRGMVCVLRLLRYATRESR